MLQTMNATPQGMIELQVIGERVEPRCRVSSSCSRAAFVMRPIEPWGLNRWFEPYAAKERPWTRCQLAYVFRLVREVVSRHEGPWRVEVTIAGRGYQHVSRFNWALADSGEQVLARIDESMEFFADFIMRVSENTTGSDFS